IHFMAGLPDGSVLSAAEDRLLVLTKGGVMSRLAEDLAIPTTVEYSEARQLLAYATTTSAILLDIETRHTTRLSNVPVWSVAFTEDASHVAVADVNSELTVWSTGTQPRIVWQHRLPAAGRVVFAGNEWVVTLTQDGFATISRLTDAEFRITVDSEVFTVSPERLVIGDIAGVVTVFKLPSLERESSLVACRER